MKSLDYSFAIPLCALVIGILLVVWPTLAVNYLVITIGVLFLLSGLVGIFSFFFAGGVISPIGSLGSAILGIWLIVTPEFFVKILVIVLGVLLLLGGLNQLVRLVSVRRFVHIPVIMYVFPILIMASGVVVCFDPFGVLQAAFIMLGISFIVYSLTDILRLLRFRRKTDGIQDITPVE